MSTFFECIITLCILFGFSLSKIFEIYTRDHYHDFMQDMPVGVRYASIVAFYNDTKMCQANLASLPWTEVGLPSVEHLFLGQYELSTKTERVWYVFIHSLINDL